MDIKNYLLSVGALSKHIADGKVSESEADRLGKSDLWWVRKHNNTFYSGAIRQGDVFQFEFGKNLPPEMSYEHRGLVIGRSKQLLYVLPIFSYLPDKHDDLYSKTNQKGNQYLLTSSNYPFLKHDSILKLNDMRSVSTKRIMYHQKDGYMDPASDAYKEIRILSFSRIFPEYHYELMISRSKTS